jgi:hypothetical protein
MLFGSGIAKRAHCTLASVQTAEERKRTLRTLMELAEGTGPSACYDDRRVIELLRSQSSAEEMRALGMSEALIHIIFEEEA